MNFDLPATDTVNPPAFTTLRACEDWLTRLPTTNPVHTQAELQKQLSLLGRYMLAANERFAILEALRGPLLDVQYDIAQKFAARPLPLTPPEQAALDSTQTLWQALLTNHLHCLTAAVATPASAASTARIIQRTLAVLADWQLTLIYAEHLPPATYWAKLNQIFASAEAAGLAQETVRDPLRHGSLAVSPLAAFTECHLLHTASPFELPARHIAWVARWARRWGSKIGLLAVPPEDVRNRALPLWVDLASNQPASYLPQPSSHGRWLETTALRTSLGARIALLDKGRAPADLQLGDDVTQPAARQLLARLLQRWCQGGIPRQHPRHAASADCEFVVGFEAMHFQLAGRRLFQPPAQGEAALRRQREELETFGGRRHSQGAEPAATVAIEYGKIIDDGHLADESADGLRLIRPLHTSARIGAGMLIAVRRSPAPDFMVGAVRWVLCQDAAYMSAGVHLFPGTAHPVAARLLDPEAGPWRPCVLLFARNGGEKKHSIVLPVGSFRLGREIEVMVHTASRIRLTHLLDHGSEFEHCIYEK